MRVTLADHVKMCTISRALLRLCLCTLRKWACRDFHASEAICFAANLFTPSSLKPSFSQIWLKLSTPLVSRRLYNYHITSLRLISSTLSIKVRWTTTARLTRQSHPSIRGDARRRITWLLTPFRCRRYISMISLLLLLRWRCNSRIRLFL